jgi:hypothetical protein
MFPYRGQEISDLTSTFRGPKTYKGDLNPPRFQAIIISTSIQLKQQSPENQSTLLHFPIKPSKPQLYPQPQTKSKCSSPRSPLSSPLLPSQLQSQPQSQLKMPCSWPAPEYVLHSPLRKRLSASYGGDISANDSPLPVPECLQEWWQVVQVRQFLSRGRLLLLCIQRTRCTFYSLSFLPRSKI